MTNERPLVTGDGLQATGYGQSVEPILMSLLPVAVDRDPLTV